jgi:serine/threonine protein kinase
VRKRRNGALTPASVSVDVLNALGALPHVRPPPSGDGESPSAPARLGRFELIERIGAGGMAEVFRAAVKGPEGFHRELVVKRVLPQLSARARFTQMFVNEAKISALLAHPNIVQIFEFGESDGAYFIAMESIRGLTVREVLTKLRQQDRVMPVVAAAEIAREVLIALDYAHNLRSAEGRPLEIIHRDISPSNIMLADTGAVKVLDFGIARAADLMADDEGKVVKGKIAYLAPEQITCSEIDARVDVFAVGCVLHEILTGRVMFRAHNDLQTKIDLLAKVTEPPSAWNPDVPTPLDAIVARATARDRDARYLCAADMLADLETYLAAFRSPRREVLRLVRSLSDGPREEDTPRGSGPAVRVAPAASAPHGETSPEILPASDLPPRPVSGSPPPDRADDASSSSAGRGEVLARASSHSAALGELALAGHVPSPRDAWQRRFVKAGVAAAAVAVLGGAMLAGRAVLRRGSGSSVGMTTANATLPTAALVTFRSSPPGAWIVDGTGRTIGVTPATLAVTPSNVSVSFRFEKEGYRTATAAAVPSSDRIVSVDLRPVRHAEKAVRKAPHAKRPIRGH